MTVDILAIGAHPDDIELTSAGLLLKAKQSGTSIGILDLTRGEMGSRGTPEERDAEAAAAGKLLDLDFRQNLGLPDGHIHHDEATIARVVEVIRETKPRMLVAPYWEDHHPDHANTSRVVKDAWWFAGIKKYPLSRQLEAHRPETVVYYQARYAFTPTFIMDISDVFETKMASVKAYTSQLFQPGSGGTQTYIADENFLKQWEARHMALGAQIGVRYGEAYVTRNPVGIQDPNALLWGRAGVI